MRLIARMVAYAVTIRLATMSGRFANALGNILLSIAALPWPGKILVVLAYIVWQPSEWLFSFWAWAAFKLAEGLTYEQRLNLA